MSVKAIRLSNFMAFEDTRWIEISPITLLFGKNSSGKSAIIRALRFLKQTIEYPSEEDIFTYSVEEGIDLGSYIDIAHGKNKLAYKENKKKLAFGFRCEIGAEFFDFIDVNNNQKSVDFILEYGYNISCDKVNLTKFIIELPTTQSSSNKKTIIQVEITEFSETLNENSKIVVLSDFENLIGDQPSFWSSVFLKFDPFFLPRLAGREQSDLQSKGYEFIDRLLAEIREQVLDFLRKIVHIGPLRPAPSRLFTLTGYQQKIWGKFGLDSYLKLLKGESIADLNYWMTKLGFGELDLPRKYSRSPGKAIVTELLINNVINHVNLSDVGFGVSQTLPIIAACLVTEKNRLIIIEQPELHLHPAAQAELADLFIKAAIDQQKWFLVETHSEHFLLRIMRRVRETYTQKLPKGVPEISSHHFGVYVISRPRDSQKSIIEAMDFSKDGALISPWPGGFFEEGFNERFS